uniref:Uncharacterized protein n=1 Tax=Lotus japonicus TaxID=34305 RepID=I3T1Q1_LOTJA|nr:unknown [Lotus japonicus]
MSPTVTPCRLKKMTRTLASGFLTTITMNQCSPCLRESMRRSMLWVGIALVPNCEKMTSTFMVYSMIMFQILFWL